MMILLTFKLDSRIGLCSIETKADTYLSGGEDDDNCGQSDLSKKQVESTLYKACKVPRVPEKDYSDICSQWSGECLKSGISGKNFCF